MGLKPGYKQTEVGIIPEDWEVKQVRDLRPFVTSGSRGWAEFYSDRGAPFIRITNLSRDSIYLDLEDLRLVNLPKDTSEGTRTQLQDNDVLISITADIGIIGYVSSNVPKPAYINQHIALVRFDSSTTNPKFVSYFLASEKPQKLFRALTDAGAKAGMSLITVQKIHIALPPTKAEQEAIAEALSDADALIESLEQLIAKKRRLKGGIMQELLRPKDGWVVKRLGEVADIRDGTHQTPKYVEGGVPFFSVENVTSGDFVNTKFISEEEHCFLTRSFKIEKGDILMTRIGSIGDCKFIDWDVDASFYVSLALLKIRRGYSAAFVYHYSKTASFKKEVELNSLQSAIPKKINLGKIADIRIEIPDDPDEQSSVAAILSDMDAEIAALEAKLDKARQVKQGMMHDLLTGGIRLV